MNTSPARLQGYLSAYAQGYPGAWKQFELMRGDRGILLPSWPEWCWCPLAGAFAVISGGGEMSPLQALDVSILGGLAAWRMTQGIYRFDRDLFQALWDTPMDAKLPIDALYQLPEWCVYIENPRPQEDPLKGWFAFLEWDAGTGRAELRLLMDDGEVLRPGILHLTRSTLDECIEEALLEARLVSTREGLGIDLPAETGALMARILAPMVSVTLYICSLAADISDLRGKKGCPENPLPKKTKKGLRTFPQPETTWLVGHRIGASLRLAKGPEKSEYQGGVHSSPRPHIRRAHWHAYWTGPRTDKQKLILKWLPPVLVGAGEIVPTIRVVD